MNNIISFRHLESAFTEKLSSNSTVKFEQECHFAIQAVKANKQLLDILQKNPKSIEEAIINIANTDISLNPVEKLSYLIPRNGKCCLDISYQGLYAAAVRSESIQCLQTVIVKEKESSSFKYNGPYAMPTHVFSPFDSDRGKTVGVYCVAVTNSEKIMTEVMTYEECMKIKSVSKMSSFGPWKDWEDEMIRKTVIKRASKSWPKGKNKILSNVINYLNETEGIDFENQNSEKTINQPVNDFKEKSEIKELIREELRLLTKDFSPNQKINFMKEVLGVSKFDLITSCTLDEMKLILKKLQERSKNGDTNSDQA